LQKNNLGIRGLKIVLKATCGVQLKITSLSFKGINMEMPLCEDSKLQPKWIDPLIALFYILWGEY